MLVGDAAGPPGRWQRLGSLDVQAPPPYDRVRRCASAAVLHAAQALRARNASLLTPPKRPRAFTPTPLLCVCACVPRQVLDLRLCDCWGEGPACEQRRDEGPHLPGGAQQQQQRWQLERWRRPRRRRQAAAGAAAAPAAAAAAAAAAATAAASSRALPLSVTAATHASTRLSSACLPTRLPSHSPPQLLAPKYFLKWKQRHQVKYHFGLGGLEVREHAGGPCRVFPFACSLRFRALLWVPVRGADQGAGTGAAPAAARAAAPAAAAAAPAAAPAAAAPAAAPAPAARARAQLLVDLSALSQPAPAQPVPPSPPPPPPSPPSSSWTTPPPTPPACKSWPAARGCSPAQTAAGCAPSAAAAAQQAAQRGTSWRLAARHEIGGLRQTHVSLLMSRVIWLGGRLLLRLSGCAAHPASKS